MKNLLTSFKLPAILSTILIAPFALLEATNRQNLRGDFPFLLFGVMWVLSLLFFLILTPIVRNARAGRNILAHPFALLASAACLVLIAALWGAILLDQMPCFLGIPNCD